MQKHIGAPYATNFGTITKRFSERCQEYKDAKIPLIPTTAKTVRVESLDGPMPITSQVIDIPFAIVGSCTIKGFNHIMELN